ncbi:hypothetical protein BpHYR1_018123 [Brachionus plicatilis]|uniref:Chitin-binding type-2 domain-containing protein n=1 Tax=Brachionus plicatilis TaxID=10195 RepID=A0A3M7QYM4_BRAPC|nr:hypothetical protein BpHYR1_018123 [Brachionus plicatilis]
MAILMIYCALQCSKMATWQVDHRMKQFEFGIQIAAPNIYNISLIYEKIKEREKNLCSSRQDGYYPNIKNDCVDFFKCENLKTVKRSKCSNGLKFNMITLKCDHTSNIQAPCGTKIISNHYLHLAQFNFTIQKENFLDDSYDKN